MFCISPSESNDGNDVGFFIAPIPSRLPAFRRSFLAVKSVVYFKYGGPEELEVRDVPEPSLRPHEVMVRVHAATVNPVDWKVLRGDLKLVSGRRMPRCIGCDFAGTVIAAGTTPGRFKTGDGVLGSISPLSGRQGSFAELVCIPENRLVLKPPDLPFTDAAGLPIAGVAALDCVHRLGQAQHGQHALIIGATGGVGSFCVQLAKLQQLEVTAVCRSGNAELARELGADAIIPYDCQDPLDSRTAFDLIIDAAARYSYRRCAHLLTPRGVYVNTMPGGQTIFDAVRTAVLGKRKARVLFARMERASVERLTQLAGARRLRVIATHTFPLTRVRDAIALSINGHVRGKIAVVIAND
jgi:NADPH:quinone reductase-like Zn-dependent oxidoreductase